MFVGRKKELAILENAYHQSSMSMIILYGRDGIGKTRLMKEFAQDKTHIYYLGREYSKQEQKRHFDLVLEGIRQEVEEDSDKRICFFVDEFDQIQKAYKDFFDDLDGYFLEHNIANQIMLVLASSSVQWIENVMVKTMGTFAGKITSFVKLKEFTFLEMVSYFPDNTTEECIAISGVLGGVPRYLTYWDKSLDIRANITKLFLEEKGPMRMEAIRFLKMELRELSVYNTILSVLAENQNQLNYLYLRTGFSRAKISVYIKNLIELDVAHKIFSFETTKRENIQKGLYGISDSFLNFWYKFIYPNLSELEWMEADQFYEEMIKSELDEYMKLSYIKVCKEFLDLMNQYGKLPIVYQSIGSLYGKEGFIPLIGRSEQDELLVGTCKWSDDPMNLSEFEELLGYMEQTGKEADYYFLFSKVGFTSELDTMTKGLENITLIDLDSL